MQHPLRRTNRQRPKQQTEGAEPLNATSVTGSDNTSAKRYFQGSKRGNEGEHIKGKKRREDQGQVPSSERRPRPIYSHPGVQQQYADRPGLVGALPELSGRNHKTDHYISLLSAYTRCSQRSKPFTGSRAKGYGCMSGTKSTRERKQRIS